MAVGLAILAISGNLAVGGLLALVGAVLVLIGITPQEYDEEEQPETEEELLNVNEEE